MKNKNKILVLAILIILTLLGLNRFNLEDINILNLDETNLSSNYELMNTGEPWRFDTSSVDNNDTIEMDPCDIDGKRLPKVKVDTGVDTSYAERNYYGYTNEYAQLVYVHADDIIIQNDEKEKEFETAYGRYCNDVANVSGVDEQINGVDLDKGHAGADSLGFGSNAYNVTPQSMLVNRQGGDQYAFEELIRKSEYNGKDVTDFNYYIEYPNNETQIPSKYYVDFKIDGEQQSYTFENI